MPNCEGCGAFVTPRYVRVFAPTGNETVQACPQCPENIRSGSWTSDDRVRERRSGGNS